MTLGGLFGRVAFQMFFGVLFVLFAGGGLYWIIAIFFTIPAIGLSLLIFAPLEYLSASLGVRWLAWIAMPFVGALCPRLVALVDSNPNFASGVHDLAFFSTAAGVLWTLSSVLSAYLHLPIVPDKRLID
ncbi:membrane protein implicated in regulation of membrane protease activity [Rhizobium sp. BK226]|uniref:hypothetical protein n=1 Tax=Rhizobium sp. BK226 TaxID=2587075 RepID=UPI001621F639|nr:hypothetical protein [Rhizobium sp. BK226]MBB4115810.1 membrane protein implicated in regulation of membrane protease activity [Rhizobium sp. BK226]